MKTFSHLWQYVAKFFSEWEFFSAKVVEKIKTHILCSVTCSRKSYRLWDSIEKCGGDRGATNDITTWRIRVACWKNKAICASGYSHACTHRHRPVSNTCCFSTATMIRERASVLRYTYIACVVGYCPVIRFKILKKKKTVWSCSDGNQKNRSRSRIFSLKFASLLYQPTNTTLTLTVSIISLLLAYELFH